MTASLNPVPAYSTPLVKQMKITVGEDLIAVVLVVIEHLPSVVSEMDALVLIEQPLVDEQRVSLLQAVAQWTDHGRIPWGLMVMTPHQISEGHPFDVEADFNPTTSRLAKVDAATADDIAPLLRTSRLMLLHRRGIAIVGEPVSHHLQEIDRDNYWTAVLAETRAYLQHLPTQSTTSLLHLCRLLAYRRSRLFFNMSEAGRWGMQNLDPRFQSLLQRALTAHQSGTGTDTYNAYQLNEFADYVRDKMGIA